MAHYRCNVRSIWDLWWFGNTSENIAPYRMLHVWDLGTPADSSLLSRGSKVLQKLEQLAKEANPALQLRSLNITESRAVFSSAFDALCLPLRSDLTAEQVDRRHYGESSYLTFYDLINKTKKRNLAQAFNDGDGET